MADPARIICESVALREGGRAVRFTIVRNAQPVACFAVRYDGQVHAYVNHCPHKGTELDWNPGEVFDESGLYLICATHGALFEPGSGACIFGPCHGDHLSRVAVVEQDGLIRVGSKHHEHPE